MGRTTRWLIGLLIILIAAGAAWYFAGDRIAGWLSGGTGQEAAAQDQGGGPPRAVPVRTEAVASETVRVTVESVGTLQAREQVTLTSQVQGSVTAIGFQEGQRVEQGQVLVELDAERERAELENARAQLKEARRQLQRGRQLRSDGLIPQADLDELRAAFENAQAQVRVAEAALQDQAITAPFAGRIGLRQVSPGTLLQPGMPVATLATVDPMDLSFDLPSRVLPELRTGQAVLARADGFDGQAYRGELTAIDTDLNPDTRTITVQASLPNPDGLLRPGLFMNVELVLDTRENPVIPEQALVLEGDRQYVFVVEQSAARRTPVETGRRRDGGVEIVEGLEPGAQVVVAGLQKIRDGQQVRPAGQNGARDGKTAQAAQGGN